MKIFIVIYKTPQADEHIDSVFFDLDEAKGRRDLLDETLTHNAQVGVVIRECVRPREWTEEQRRWLRGTS